MGMGSIKRLTILILFSLTVIHTSCSSVKLSCPPNSHANNGYCSCNSGFIFNCSVSAMKVASNTYLPNLVVNVSSYFILDAPIDQPLNYNINLVANCTNVSIVRLLYLPGLNVLVDEGVFNSYLSAGFSGSMTELCSLNLQSYFQLANQPGTQDPELLVLVITIASPVSLYLTYSYSTTSSSNLFMILGYVAGGLLIAISIIFIALLYRKRRREGEEGGQENPEPKQIDISHFDEVMPATVITVNLKKEMQVCSVCLQEYDFESIVRKSICGHVFHRECLDEWCLKNLSCPMCRTDLSHINILKLRIESAKNDTTDWVMNTIDQEDVAESAIREPLVERQGRMDNAIENDIEMARYHNI